MKYYSTMDYARLTWHGGLAIVGVDLQGGMHANRKALLCCMESLLGGVAPCVADDQDVVAEEIHSMADQHYVLIPVHELHSKHARLQHISTWIKRRFLVPLSRTIRSIEPSLDFKQG